MNLLHPHPPPPNPHVYFPFRNILIQNSRTKKGGGGGGGLLLRMRCKSWEPGRDRIISFGKYKGKMLGSLPSRYLKWVSSNLRAGDYQEWAKLADQVLQDPIYRDRIEWEFALNVLDGNNLNSSSSGSSSTSTTPVSLLLDISHRYGWDNQDKLGWSKVDFDLLGTSRGGRIPRLQGDYHYHHHHIVPPTSTNNDEEESRRLQRRERQKNMRLRRTQQALQHKENKNDFDYEDGHVVRQNQKDVANNPFPGRQALLHRTLTHKHNS